MNGECDSQATQAVKLSSLGRYRAVGWLWEYVYDEFNLKGWLSSCVFVFVFVLHNNPLSTNSALQATSAHKTKRNHSSVIGQGVVKVLHANTIVSGMDSCVRIIGLLHAMGVISSLRVWMRLIGIVSVPPPPL